MQRTDLNPVLILTMILGLALLAGCPAGEEPAGAGEQAAATAPEGMDSPQVEQLETAEEQQPVDEQSDHPDHAYDPARPLNEQYAEMKASQNAPEEVKQMFADQRAAITAANMLDSALGKGDLAPGFTLPADSGGAVALETALSDGPAVLVFFRGGW